MNLTVTPYNFSAKAPMQMKENSISFTAHPDYYALKRAGYKVKTSSYFRRGDLYGSPSTKFVDIVKIFSLIFYEPFKKPQKMLIAGIGDSQETFSYLAVIKNILKQKDISDVVDLYSVDLQSKPSAKKLKIDSFYDGIKTSNMFAENSFVEDINDYGQPHYKELRVKDDIFNLVKKAYADKSKSKWNTRIQEAIKTYEDNYFDIISSNNTLGYLKSKEEIAETVRQMFRCLKPGGYLIVDPYYNHINNAGLGNKMSFVSEGIYKKL